MTGEMGQNYSRAASEWGRRDIPFPNQLLFLQSKQNYLRKQDFF